VEVFKDILTESKINY